MLRWTALVMALSVGVLAGQSPMWPFPNHEAPPEGWFCHPAQSDEEVLTDPHACECVGMVSEPLCPMPNEDGTLPEVPESSRCKVFCHKDHCTCARMCADS